MTDLKEKIAGIIAKNLGLSVDEVTPEKSLEDDLGADSLDRIDLLVQFEEEFDIPILEIDVTTIVKVSDIVETVERLMQEKSA